LGVESIRNRYPLQDQLEGGETKQKKAQLVPDFCDTFRGLLAACFSMSFDIPAYAS